MGIAALCTRLFDFTGRIGPQLTMELRDLDNPITKSEILKVLNDMPGGKASGPDGIPIEFYKYFWNIVKNELSEFVISFFSHNATKIRHINWAAVTLIPKKKQIHKEYPIIDLSVLSTQSPNLSQRSWQTVCSRIFNP